ncbi:hypothetical protein CPLU01_03948 [Colletotrichum plurivorum]|uniref:Uncharacterized protein n=1 Tax=Colletotrichum plurivorum TaxID=2175906 RepID=A0A8H6NKE2_9PEZI|nr:hypothetical protein CPLU01_03948 [Colletotrichum plurivorum]
MNPHPQRFPWLSQDKGLDLVLERVQTAPWAEPNHTSELLLMLSRRLVSSSKPAPEGSYRQTARQQRDTVCDTTRLWLKRHPLSGTRTIGSSEVEKSATLTGHRGETGGRTGGQRSFINRVLYPIEIQPYEVSNPLTAYWRA